MSRKSEQYTDFVFTNFVILLVVWVALFYVLMSRPNYSGNYTYGSKQSAIEALK